MCGFHWEDRYTGHRHSDLPKRTLEGCHIFQRPCSILCWAMRLILGEDDMTLGEDPSLSAFRDRGGLIGQIRGLDRWERRIHGGFWQ